MRCLASLLSSLLLAACTSSVPAPHAAAPAPPPTIERLPLAQQRIERLAPKVWRLHPSPGAARDALPSFALLDPRPPAARAQEAPPVQPVFLEHRDGRVGFALEVEPGTSLYGLGEAPGPLERTGTRTVLWNTDAYGYRGDAESLYQSHPWLLAVRADGSAFGLLADTTWRTEVDLSDGIQVLSEGPAFPVLVFEGERPQDVLHMLATWTGRMRLPPRWALGFHQCRYSYTPAGRVLEVAQTFRAKKIPADVIWMDIDYMHDFRIFSFHPERFADPAKLNADLAALDFHNVWMINPGIAADRAKFPPGGYALYDAVIEGGHAVRRSDGRVYVGQVWPGDTVFPDFTDPRTRAWWSELYRGFAAQGVTGVWNDMNEPALFSTVSRTMPVDNVHRGDPARGGPGLHARFHNVYGMLMAEATWAGMRDARPQSRPFVLSRAGYVGIQRYAATWTGDNTADWWDLDASIPMVLNLGLSGQPFSGPDIGGFIGDGSAELYGRWIALGAFLPFSRGHTAKGTRDKEPWAFGPEIEAVARTALERRYRLMPYLYTVFREATVSGLPVARPVFFADPADPKLRSEDDAFLLGEDVLVVPTLTSTPTGGPALPKGRWRSMWPTDGWQADLRVRPGAVVATGPTMQHAGSPAKLVLHVNLDREGRAEGVVYDDAGDGYGYRAGDFSLTRFEAQRDEGGLTVRATRLEGTREVPWERVEVRWLTDGGARAARGQPGAEIRVGGPDS